MSHYDKRESMPSFSRKPAEANGGRIEVKSESGKGSTFTVSLPVSKKELE